MLKPIGIFGGTFDPVHYGHLRLGLELLRQIDLQEIRLIPLYTPVHRAAPIASASQRLEMLQLAISDARGLMVDDRELIRRGISYSIDTVRSLREEYPQQPICLIIGMDAFRILDTWRDWSSFLKMAHLIIVDRPGPQAESLRPILAELLRSHQSQDPQSLTATTAGAIIKISAPLLEISSTYIRELIRAGDSINRLSNTNASHKIAPLIKLQTLIGNPLPPIGFKFFNLFAR